MSKSLGRGHEVPDDKFICGVSEVAELIRNFPWHLTELGPITNWSGCLCTMVNLVLASPIPSAIHWGSSLLTIYNDSYVSLLGDKHPKALGTPASEIWCEVWPLVGDEYLATLKSGIARFEERVLIPIELQGQIRDIYWNYVMTPITENGRVTGILKTCQDVTEQVATMDALVESDQRLRLALSAGDCIGTWDWNIQNDLIYSDGRLATAFGANPTLASEGIPLEVFLKQVHPADRGAVELAIVQAIDSREDYIAEYRVLQPDGSARWVEAKGRCIFSDTGLPQRFPGILFDISMRKEAGRLAQTSQASVPQGGPVPLDTSSRELGAQEESSMFRRSQLIQTLANLLAAGAEQNSKSSAQFNRQQAEQILALLSEGLLLEHHFTQYERVPINSVADAAIQLEQEQAHGGGPYLVPSSPADELRTEHLAHLLQAVWALLGETIQNLGITPVPLRQVGQQTSGVSRQR